MVVLKFPINCVNVSQNKSFQYFSPTFMLVQDLTLGITCSTVSTMKLEEIVNYSSFVRRLSLDAIWPLFIPSLGFIYNCFFFMFKPSLTLSLGKTGNLFLSYRTSVNIALWSLPLLWNLKLSVTPAIHKSRYEFLLGEIGYLAYKIHMYTLSGIAVSPLGISGI